MECSSDINSDIMNTSVVEDEISSSNVGEKPLSPILSGSLNNRKFLIGRKLNQRRNTRVKLRDRFKENDKDKQLIVSPINMIDQIAFEDSLSANPTKMLIDHLEKLEELENSRKDIYEKLVRDNRNTDVLEKNNKSPDTKNYKEGKNCIKNSGIGSNTSTKSKYSQDIQLDEIVLNSTKDLSVAFHTATGRNISVSDSDVKNCTKLFEDIICRTQHCYEGRQNKYSFLRKKKPHDLKSNVNFKLNKSLKGSRSSFNISEKVKHVFNEEDFSDINCNGLHCEFKKACLPINGYQESLIKQRNSIKTDKDNSGISLTQAIHESEISNTQMLNAVDDILLLMESNNEDFKGFSKSELKESNEKLQNLQKFLGRNFELSEFPEDINPICFVRKDSHTDKSSKSEQQFDLSRKRPRKWHQFITNRNCSNNNENDKLLISNNSRGFLTAAAKSITLTENSIRHAGIIFDDMDFYPPHPKKIKTEIVDLNKNENPVNINFFNGFHKASGKLISVSESCIQQAKNLFDILDLENYGEKVQDGILSVNSGKIPVTCISDISREKRRNLIKNFPICAKDMVGKNEDYFNEFFQESIPIYKDFGSENFNTIGTAGFCKASGKEIKISNTAIKKAKSLFETLDLENCEEKLHEKSKISKKMPVTSKSDISQEKRKNSIKTNSSFSCTKEIQDKNITEEYYVPDSIPIANFNNIPAENFNVIGTTGFSKASGKVIEVSNIAIKKAKTLFDSLDMENYQEKVLEASKLDIPLQKTKELINISFPSSTKDVNSKNRENHFQDSIQQLVPTDFQPDNVNAINLRGFCKASGKVVEVSNTAIKKAESIFDDLSMEFLQNDDQTLTKPNSYLEPTENLQMNKDCAQHLSTAENISSNISIKKESSVSETTPVRIRSKLGARSSKKKLGISHFKQIQIGDNKLDRAKLLFDEDFSKISPIKPIQNIKYTSTPIRQNESPVLNNNNTLRPKNFSSILEATDITPITKRNIDYKQEHFNTDLTIHSPTNDNWLDELEAEKKKVELRLNVLSEREKLGKKMMYYLKMGKSVEDKKPRKGILYKMKTTCYKTSLNNFVNKEKPGANNLNFIITISPKNAENLHFKGQLSGSILTEDEAVVIPNLKDMVGLSEIKNAFEFMPGIEPRLIPNGWVRNHYKWIVWKLASYENMFPRYFSGCLNIENIMQQLKYRYDREIDRAERSALRRICEKDDAPQKRMILLVSNVKMLDVRIYELELCDGWYAVRTVIDEPLCNQINNGKIVIGTKLLISGAELLNCDGCHPLEATNLVCLKINCNSTRRTSWHTKLGFQRNPNPFPIELQSIYPGGGMIGAIKVCIVRVYPLKYMEKLQGRTVWRNRKADEIAAQKWENERSKKLEQIQDEVSKKLENSYNKSATETFVDCDISNVTCPKQLHEIMKKSNDPESFQENLSMSQKEAVLNYRTNLSMKRQMEMAAEVKASVSKMKMSNRDVTAVLKLLVIDSIKQSDKPYNFIIWRPTELHLQTLKEGKSFTIQNVLPRPNGDLSSTAKTIFKPEQSDDRSVKYKRCLIRLSELAAGTAVPYFNEFDTVGLVVQIKIQSHMQEVWITDHARRLLFVTIYEGSDTCSLLENLKRGQATTVCNLIYRGMKKNIMQAVANHYTVFSSYSQHKHLQEGLDVFKKEIVNDIPNLLNDCDTKIEVFKIVTDINSFSENFEDPNEDTFTWTITPKKNDHNQKLI